MRLPIQVQAIVFRRIDDAKLEFLLLKRIPEKGGFWQPVSGGYEEEDTSLKSCAIREACEEGGFNEKDVVKVVENVQFYQFQDKAIVRSEYVFGVEVSRLFPLTTVTSPEASPLATACSHLTALFFREGELTSPLDLLGLR